MFFMGAGSYVSKYIKSQLFETFITIEIVLGLLGGISAIVLYFTFAYTPHYYLYNFVFIAVLGLLIGLEIPIVARIITHYTSFKETVAEVFSFDYMGALVASVIFPLVLLPTLGIIKTALFIGIINLLIAFYNALFFRDMLTHGIKQAVVAGVIIAGFASAMFFSPYIDYRLEQKIYQDQVIFSEQTPYQKLVLTRWNNDYRLFINGAIQFSSIDEYRYHESLVHLPMLLAQDNAKVLVLGGGDGMAVREVLKYPKVEQIDLVDLDPAMTELGQTHPVLLQLNQGALNHSKVHIYNKDAYNFVHQSSTIYDVIIIDLPDPNNTGLGKLYSREFYSMLKGRLAAGGILATQSTSPYFAREAFWCIKHTIASVFDATLPYQTNVPSFGIWGFVMAGGGLRPLLTDSTTLPNRLVKKFETKRVNQPAIQALKYLTPGKIPTMLFFEKDMADTPTKINTLSTQPLVDYYNKSADNWR